MRLPNKFKATLYDDFLTGDYTAGQVGQAGFQIVTTTGRAPVNPLCFYVDAVAGHPGVLGLKASYDSDPSAEYGDVWLKVSGWPKANDADTTNDHALVCTMRDIRKIGCTVKVPNITDFVNCGISLQLGSANGNDGYASLEFGFGHPINNWVCTLNPNAQFDNTIPVVVNAWTTMEMVFDVESTSVYYFINGVCIGTQNVPSTEWDKFYIPGLYIGAFDAGTPTLTAVIDEFYFETADQNTETPVLLEYVNRADVVETIQHIENNTTRTDKK